MSIFEKNYGSEYSDAITMVHKEFKEAGDKLFDEASKILESKKVLNMPKYQRLKALGFTAAKEVVEAERILSERKMHEDLVILVQHYRMRYPFNKFITLEKVQEICQKYGLVYGEVSRYTGFIPEVKLSEMEKFKFKKDDGPLEFQFGGSWYSEEDLKKPWSVFPGSKYLDDQEKYDESINAGKPMNDHCRYKDSEFLICAPLKNMNISSREQIINYKIVPVPDPVVLKEVKGGFLIVTAWGDEASDPNVVNEINN